MFIIWRRWGFLILPLILVAWQLAEGVITDQYRANTGAVSMYNADKAITWAIALFVIAVPLFIFNLTVLRSEGKQLYTPEEWKVYGEKQIAKYKYVKMIGEDESDEARHRARIEAIYRDSPPPVPTKTSTFFFIPMKFFPLVFIAVGILLLAVNIPNALSTL